jgi:hypothetical protein
MSNSAFLGGNLLEETEGFRKGSVSQNDYGLWDPQINPPRPLASSRVEPKPIRPCTSRTPPNPKILIPKARGSSSLGKGFTPPLTPPQALVRKPVGDSFALIAPRQHHKPCLGFIMAILCPYVLEACPDIGPRSPTKAHTRPNFPSPRPPETPS